MATLILNAGSGSAVSLIVQSAGEGAPEEVGSVTRSFNGADRSSVRGVKRSYGSLTTYLDTVSKDAVINLLKWGNQIPCSGDLLGNLQTQCSVRYTGCRMIQGTATGLWEVGLSLSEVQPSVTLLRYAPGDTITGEAFTRSTTAPYISNGGTLPTAAINAKRDNHWPGAVGPRSTLLEGARTNSVSQPNDATNAAWTKTNCTALKNATGPDAVANSASTLTATATGASASVPGAAVLASSTQTISGVVKAGSPASGWAWVGDGGDAVWHRFWINLTTGAIGTQAGLTRATVLGLAGGWYYWTLTYLTTNAYTAQLYGGMSTADNGFANAVGDKLQVAVYDHELNAPFASSPMPGARGSDSYSLPFTYPPIEMTLYAKFVELGTLLSAGRVGGISANPAAAPDFQIVSDGSTYSAFHANGVSSVSSALAVAPAFGDTVELVAHLFGDGSVNITQSINGGAAAVSTQSAALALATAWSGQLAWLNSIAASNVGFTALQSFKIVAGARSLAEMRAA